MARRRFQNGQLVDNKKLGRWEARWREDVLLPDGGLKRPKMWQPLAMKRDCTKRQAERLLSELLQRRGINRSDYRPAWAGTFADFALSWEKKILPEHKPSTQGSERSVIKVHLKPVWGALELREITTEEIQTWIAKQKGRLSAKTICNVVRVLQSMWTTARAWGYVEHDPFAGLVLPTVVKGNVYTFTAEEARAIIEKAPPKWKLFFCILAETGIRPGELAGLKRSNCQLRAITVTQSVWSRKVQTPKSAAGVRRFPISDVLGSALRNFIEASETNAYDLVFVTDRTRAYLDKNGEMQNEGGKPLSMDSFRQRVLDPILDELGIREKVRSQGIRCGNYAFRHMNATQMDGWNTPLKVRQSRLGHASAQVTLDHYTEPLAAADLEVADRMGQLFSVQVLPVQ